MIPFDDKYILKNRKNSKNPPLCEICGQGVRNWTQCACCGKLACKNSCSGMGYSFNITDKPWLSQFKNQPLCNECMYGTLRTSSIKNIDKLFIELFKK